MQCGELFEASDSDVRGLTDDKVGTAEEHKQEEGGDHRPVLEKTRRQRGCLREQDLDGPKTNEAEHADR